MCYAVVCLLLYESLSVSGVMNTEGGQIARSFWNQGLETIQQEMLSLELCQSYHITGP